MTRLKKASRHLRTMSEQDAAETEEYRVEVWHKTERTVTVEAESKEDAEEAAEEAVVMHDAGTAMPPTENEILSSNARKQ
jgi:hypothetical protein